MGKRGRIIIVCSAVVLLAMVAGILILTPAREPEPVYEGKTLSEWLLFYERHDPADQEAANRVGPVIRQTGTNAIPTLLHMLRAHDSDLKIKVFSWVSERRLLGFHYTPAETLNRRASLGFQFLGPRASNAVPELVKILDLNLSQVSASYTMYSLGEIGPSAKAAVPSILRVTTSTNITLRWTALQALGDIHAEPESVVPVLIKARHDSSADVRATAAIALGQFGNDAKPAVPTLVEWLADTNEDLAIDFGVFVRDGVKHALQRIDPETYARVTTNEAAPNP